MPEPFIDHTKVAADITAILKWLRNRPRVKIITSKDVGRIICSRCGSHLRAVYHQVSICFPLVRMNPGNDRGNRFIWDVSSVHVGSDYPW